MPERKVSRDEIVAAVLTSKTLGVTPDEAMAGIKLVMDLVKDRLDRVADHEGVVNESKMPEAVWQVARILKESNRYDSVTLYALKNAWEVVTRQFLEYITPSGGNDEGCEEGRDCGDCGDCGGCSD